MLGLVQFYAVVMMCGVYVCAYVSIPPPYTKLMILVNMILTNKYKDIVYS